MLVRIVAQQLALVLAFGRWLVGRGVGQRGHGGAGFRDVSHSAKFAVGSEGSVLVISREPGARSSGREIWGKRVFIVEL